ncbi:MAG: P-II family nitrogen regulator [Pirellulales bacterium]
MKEVIAIVKPFLAERVLAALDRAPVEACTVREVKGFGRQKNYLDQYGESDYSQAFLPKVEISVWVEDQWAAEVVDRLAAVARTGRMGDGKVFVLPASEVTGGERAV